MAAFFLDNAEYEKAFGLKTGIHKLADEYVFILSYQSFGRL
jgi:hypothetical protein